MQISDIEIYLLIKYIKSVLWRVAKRLSYIEDARCLRNVSVEDKPLQDSDAFVYETYILNIHVTLTIFRIHYHFT